MKKVLALLVCVCIVLLLSGCADKGEEKQIKHTIDVEYYAKLGQIPEQSYHLGDDAKEMTAELDNLESQREEEEPDGEEHHLYDIVKTDDYSIISYNNAKYYYKKDGKISAIVSLDTAYDFQMGDLSSRIKEALSEFEAVEKAGDRDTVFFLPASDSYTCLEYTFGENKVIFTFFDSALCAVALLKADF